MHLSVCGSTTLCWALAAFSVSLSFTQSVGPLRRRSACLKAAIYTQDNTYTEQVHTDMHASSGIRAHDPSV
jgi:hypothetical protein